MVEHPDESLFAHDAEALDTDNVATGRAHAVFFEHNGMKLVYKHYHRGGMIAPLMGDRYLGSRVENTRAFREWRLLDLMQSLKLPVPKPVAARVIQQGVFYRADLVTCEIENSTALADVLAEKMLNKAEWYRIGDCIARFHAKKIYHADLNARNILLNNASSEASLVDFDRGVVRYLGEDWQQANLARLQRSLKKFSAANPAFHYNDYCWNSLLKGYYGTQ